jgi:DNA-binding PadR family transcriptional regulator
MARRLTTTSYALLGLLAIQPWPAYELTKYMQRTALSDLWPRTEASIYTEPKNLVAHGLATASREPRGKRSRTVYAITEAGRAAMRAWLAEPGEDLRFEFEAGLKVFFADAGSIEDLQNQLASVRQHYEAMLLRAPSRAAEWLEGQIRFPQRLHYTAIAADLIGRVRVAVAEWAADWEAKVAEWDTTTLEPTSETQARAHLTQMLRLADDYRSRRAAPDTAPLEDPKSGEYRPELFSSTRTK